MTEQSGGKEEGSAVGKGQGSRALIPVVPSGREIAVGVSELRQTSSTAPAKPPSSPPKNLSTGTIRNESTRRAYRDAVKQFLAWCEQRALEFVRICATRRRLIPDQPHQENWYRDAQATLLALHHFFDGLGHVPRGHAELVRSHPRRRLSRRRRQTASDQHSPSSSSGRLHRHHNRRRSARSCDGRYSRLHCFTRGCSGKRGGFCRARAVSAPLRRGGR